MNWTRFIAATGLAVVLALIADVLLNAILMRQVFVESAHLWLPAEELNRRVPLGFLALGGTMTMLGVLFVRLGRRGVRAGLEFGLWLGLAACAGTAGLLSLVPWPPALVASMAAQQSMNDLILGYCLGRFYRD